VINNNKGDVPTLTGERVMQRKEF